MHLKEMTKNLYLIKKTLIQENFDKALQIEKEYMQNSSKIKAYFEADKQLNEICEEFTNPKDSSNYFGKISEIEIKSKYDTICSKMLKTLEILDERLLYHVKKNIQVPEFLPLSNDEEIRGLNILTNQLNILTVQLKYQLELYYNVVTSYDGHYDTRIIDNKTDTVGEKYSAYLLYVLRSPKIDRDKIELFRMTLDGNEIKPKYSFVDEDGVTKFTFIPTKSGLYEWEVRQYVLIPGGTVKIFPFKGKLKVNE